MKPVLVWDVPTRLFHWLLATSFVAAWLASQSDQWLSAHAFCGYLMLGLIGFRLVWGVVGGHYARFASFRYGPMAGLAYLREMPSRKAARHIGHNPAGSQAIYLLLLLGLTVAATGIFTLGGEEQQSRFGVAVSVPVGTMFKSVHNVAANLMLLVVIGHIAGVIVESLLHRENLPRAMVTGIKEAPEGTSASKSYGLAGAMLLAVVAAYAVWWFFYAWHQPLEKRFGLGGGDIGAANVAFVGPGLPDDPLWREECGSCHLPFHPNLLPARSWTRLMAEQKNHFGSDLGLDAATTQALLKFLEDNAAEKSPREAAFRISRSIAPEATPLRITETPYWIQKHREIAEADWRLPTVKSKVNCPACHQDATKGTFEDAAMHIPR